jgi:hypothetical protein
MGENKEEVNEKNKTNGNSNGNIKVRDAMNLQIRRKEASDGVRIYPLEIIRLMGSGDRSREIFERFMYIISMDLLIKILLELI